MDMMCKWCEQHLEETSEGVYVDTTLKFTDCPDWAQVGSRDDVWHEPVPADVPSEQTLASPTALSTWLDQ